ncbi:protein FRA10AC1 [Cimex lectularius]|uniref:Protein FRA10AC1 homolog n=1 Tax=Cimex lectularius TaxID=79782 RepID=A0A8I6SPR4_CIMLE|nr:protein FRA10AC1 [Cimex lectularius]XP_024084930.1 protein FRA10AC1 [Cimex lectularius]XP_024084931.1 protein FRA10AC1 [Cimex lectularius]
MHKTYVPRTGYLSMNPFELHKHLINTYVLTSKGSTSFLKRDTSRDKTDSDVLRENHKFLWDEDEVPKTWEERLARKYYDKLFKEFCITDLTMYKKNKIALRWQTEQELVTGKGQFICGAKGCPEKEHLKTWEVNFAYKEQGEKKNALVKLRLCNDCSTKLNYSKKRKEIKRIRIKHKTGKSSKTCNKGETTNMEEKEEEEKTEEETKTNCSEENNIWTKPIDESVEVSREEDFEKYLEHLLF